MSIRAWLSYRLLLLAKIIPPAAENSLSDGTEVAGIAKYLTASETTQGNLFFPSFIHHENGSISPDSQGRERKLRRSMSDKSGNVTVTLCCPISSSKLAHKPNFLALFGSASSEFYWVGSMLWNTSLSSLLGQASAIVFFSRWQKARFLNFKSRMVAWARTGSFILPSRLCEPLRIRLDSFLLKLSEEASLSSRAYSANSIFVMGMTSLALLPLTYFSPEISNVASKRASEHPQLVLLLAISLSQSVPQ